MPNFWKKLKKPILTLAPMANVTDAAFRRIIAEYSKPDGPDAMWTEFVSVEGLLSEGRERLLPDLWYTEAERPIVAQIFGGRPETFAPAAELVRELGFDGIDINMGCPDRGIERSGGGAALIKDPLRAKEIILETKKGAGDLPVSVKTRLGYSKNQLAEWLPQLLEAEPAAVIMHLRTRKEMSEVPAHWELAPEMARLRDKYGPGIPVLGNGDVGTLAEAEAKSIESGIDGAMVGRGIFGSPWFFSRAAEPDLARRLRIMLQHTKLFEELYVGVLPGDRSIKGMEVMKKHYKAYANGFRGAVELRSRLMAAENYAEIEEITENFIRDSEL